MKNKREIHSFLTSAIKLLCSAVAPWWIAVCMARPEILRAAFQNLIYPRARFHSQTIARLSQQADISLSYLLASAHSHLTRSRHISKPRAPNRTPSNTSSGASKNLLSCWGRSGGCIMQIGVSILPKCGPKRK